MSIICIWAESENGIIGNGNKLPWDLPEELNHFKRTTMGKTIVFGYNTFKGFDGRLLPGRTTVLLDTGNFEFADIIKGFSVSSAKRFEIETVEEVLERAKTEDVFIAGGKRTYEVFLPYADKIIRTVINKTYNGDTYAPTFNENEFVLTQKERFDDRPIWYVETWTRLEK